MDDVGCSAGGGGAALSMHCYSQPWAGRSSVANGTIPCAARWPLCIHGTNLTAQRWQDSSAPPAGFVHRKRCSASEGCQLSANTKQHARKWKGVCAPQERLWLQQFKNETSSLWEKRAWSCSCVDKIDPHSSFPLNFLISQFIHCTISLHVHIVIKSINKIFTCVFVYQTVFHVDEIFLKSARLCFHWAMY